ncbi:MAG: tetratricopeptide repeat protein [Planctomycetota bacterium]
MSGRTGPAAIAPGDPSVTISSAPPAARPCPADLPLDPSALRARSWWFGLPGCLLLALLAWLPTALRAEFLNFDDPFFFGPDNPLFRAAAERAQEHGVLAGLATVLDPRQLVADVYLPVAHGSLWLDYWWFAPDPRGPHVMAVLLHALAGFALLRWLTAMRLPAALAATATAVFLVHPALGESVAWVSSRKDVLSGLFVFAGMALVARAGRGAGLGLLVALAACGVLAMYSKATAVVQPLLAVLVCLYTGGARSRWLAPLVLLLVTAPIAWHHQLNAATAGTMVAGGAAERLTQVPGAFAHYLATALWPRGLNVLYPEVATLERFRDALWWTAPLVLVVVALGIWSWTRPRLRAVGLGAIGFLLALLPFNTAWPASVIAVADRYLYLAVPFAAVAVLASLRPLLRRPALVGVALTVPLLLATWSRAPAFASSGELWERSLAADADNAVALLNLIQARSPFAVDVAWARPLAERAAEAARYPEHARRAHLLLAQYALAEHRYQEAAQQTDAALAATERIGESGRVLPAVVDALRARTLVLAITPYRLAGRLDDARRALQRAEQVAPDDPGVVAAAVLLEVEALAAELAAPSAPAPDGAAPSTAPSTKPRLADDDPRVRTVAERIQRARATTPDAPEVECAAGTFARLRGRQLEAIACFRRALAKNPGMVDAWLGAAEVCLDNGLCAEAEDYARSGIATSRQLGQPVDPRLRLALVRGLQGLGRIDEAIESLRVYVEQRPRDRDAARLYSGLLMHKARQRLADPEVTHAELERLVERALAANPQEPAVDLVRARMLRDRREFAAAVEALDRLALALPDFEDTRAMLAENLRDLGYERLFAGDDDGAAAAWVRFVGLAPRQVDTEAVRMQLKAIWRRAEERGIAARQAGDEVAAQRAFRQCLQIDPDHHWAAWLLLTGLLDDPAADPVELQDLSDKALRWQQQHGLDRSRQVAARAMVLRRVGRGEEALALVDGYLEGPDAEAPPPVLSMLRQLRGDLAEGR